MALPIPDVPDARKQFIETIKQAGEQLAEKILPETNEEIEVSDEQGPREEFDATLQRAISKYNASRRSV